MQASRGWAWLAIGALAIGCAPAAARTQVTIYVGAEPSIRAAGTRLHILVEGGTGSTFDRTADDEILGSIPSVESPLAVALIPVDGDGARTYRVTATALDASNHVVAEARIISGYLPGRTLSYPLTIFDACRSHDCEVTETCRGFGACTNALVPTTALHDVTLTDAEVDARDMSVAVDMAIPHDACTSCSTPDVGMDAGFDAGMDMGTDMGMDMGTDMGMDMGMDAWQAPMPSGSYSVSGAPTRNCNGVVWDAHTVTFDDPSDHDAGAVPLQVMISGMHCVMTGTPLSGGSHFSATCRVQSANCDESYTLDGDFTTHDTWTGSLMVSIQQGDAGAGACSACVGMNQTYSGLSGSRL